MAGNVTHDEVVESVGAMLGHERAGEPFAMRPVLADVDGSGVRVEIANRRTDQAHICLAVDGPAANSDDRYAVDMLNTVLGEGMSSRLFVELRERRGLAYDVHSSAMHYRDCGALLVSCGVDTANATEAVRTVLHELHGVQEGVTEEELSRGTEYAVGRLGLRLEDTRAVMGWMGGQELLRNEVRTPEQVVAGHTRHHHGAGHRGGAPVLRPRRVPVLRRRPLPLAGPVPETPRRLIPSPLDPFSLEGRRLATVLGVKRFAGSMWCDA